MKTKCLPQQTTLKDHFFLLMIVPLLIGLMITFASLAHAEWNTENDPLLKNSPKSQGWRLQVNTQNSPSNLLKPEGENHLKTALGSNVSREPIISP